MNDCEKCPFKSNIPGDTHISCNHPMYEVDPSIAFKIHTSVILGNSALLKEVIGLTFSKHGVQSGWCSFPFNYDPIWIEGECKFLKSHENRMKHFNVGTVGHIDHQKSMITIKDLK
jgi:hypothetical protein